jgi:hypothetical protein
VQVAGVPARFKNKQKKYEGCYKVLCGLRKTHVEKTYQQYVKCSNDMAALKEFSKVLIFMKIWLRKWEKS